MSGATGEDRELGRDLGLQSAAKIMAEYCSDHVALPIDRSPARLACELEYFTSEFSCQAKDGPTHTVHKISFDKRRSVYELKVAFGRQMGLVSEGDDTDAFTTQYRMRLYGPHGTLLSAAEEALAINDGKIKGAEKFCIELGRPLKADEVIVNLSFLDVRFLPLSALRSTGAARRGGATDGGSSGKGFSLPMAQSLVPLSSEGDAATTVPVCEIVEEAQDMGGAAALFADDDDDHDDDGNGVGVHPAASAAAETPLRIRDAGREREKVIALERATAAQELQAIAARATAEEVADSVVRDTLSDEASTARKQPISHPLATLEVVRDGGASPALCASSCSAAGRSVLGPSRLCVLCLVL